MRLWHKDLIDALPRQQLLSQWREISAITSSIMLHGTPRHGLVNKLTLYSFANFYSYALLVQSEMHKRGYKADDRFILKIKKCAEIINEDCYIIKAEHIYKYWHNNKYLIQCYYNLEEKYDCDLITYAEFQKLKTKMQDLNIL